MPQYFTDNGDGERRFFDTLDEAKTDAQQWIDAYRDTDEWDEAAGGVCWGVVMQHAVEVEIPGTEFVDYVLKDVP